MCEEAHANNDVPLLLPVYKYATWFMTWNYVLYSSYREAAQARFMLNSKYLCPIMSEVDMRDADTDIQSCR